MFGPSSPPLPSVPWHPAQRVTNVLRPESPSCADAGELASRHVRPITPSRIGRLCELLVVGRWSVDRRHRLIVEPEIDGQLATVVCEVVERVVTDDVPRLFHHD